MFAHTGIHAQTMRKHCTNMRKLCANIAQTLNTSFRGGGKLPPPLNELFKRKQCANIAQICVNFMFAQVYS